MTTTATNKRGRPKGRPDTTNRVLLELHRYRQQHNTPPRKIDLAARLEVHPSTVTYHLNRLVERGLVNDPRLTNVGLTLTDNGVAAVELLQ